jgi:hypothetical protein
VRWKIVAVFLILPLTIGISAYATYQSRYILQQEQIADYVGIQQTIDGLKALDTAGSKAITIALSDQFFNAFTSALSGKSISLIYASLPNETLTLKIVSTSIKTLPGTLRASFDAQLSSDRRSYSVGLHVEAVAYFAGTERVSPDPSEPELFSANFKFIPLVVEPKLSYGPLNLVGRRFVSDIIDGNLIQQFLDKMKAPVLYQPNIKYVIDENGEYQQSFGDTGQNSVHYRISHTPVTIEKWVHVNSPIFTDRGVVFSASLSDDAVQAVAFEPNLSNAPLASQIEQLQQQIEGRQKQIDTLYSSSEITVTVRPDAISDLAATASTAIRKLSLSLQSTAISGRFIDKKWSDKILGDGGFYAEAAGGDRLQGSIAPTAADLKFVPGAGLNGSLALSISADADMHIHVDPLVGGGVGTTVKLKGSASPSINASVQTGTFQFQGANITFAAPVLECSAIDLQIQTDGKFVFPGGWVTVPTIGVRTGQLIGQQPLNPIVLSGIPSSLTLVAKSDTASASSSDKKQIIFKQGLYLTASIESLDIQAQADGYRFSSSIDMSVSNDLPDRAKIAAYVAQLNTAALDFWRATYNPSCPPAPDLRVLVGDLEFGPNNTIIKFLMDAWNDITKGPGKNNEVVKLLNRVNAAASTYDNDTKNLANQLGDAARKAFPHDNDIGKAAGEIAKSVTIAVTNPPAAVHQFFHQLGRGFR